MKIKCRVYFLLFSFYNCTYLSIQAPNPQVDDENRDLTDYFNYEKEALKMLEITPAPDGTIDWKEAFLKLAPVAIINSVQAKKNAIQAKQNSIQAKQNSIDAGRYHFILLTRNKIVFDENHYCTELPEDDNEFRRKIKEDLRFKNIPDQKISCKKHAKMWLWIIVKGDANIFTSLIEIRKNLNNDANRFLWFANQIQCIFDIFNDDVHSPASSILYPKHIDVNNLGTYLSFLNLEVQKAMKIFYECEAGLKVDIK